MKIIKWGLLVLLILTVLILVLSCDSEEQTFSDVPDGVSVTWELQDVMNDQQKLVIFVENNSEDTFSGSLDVKAKDLTDEVLGSDIIYVDKLKPSTSTYAILWIDPTDEVDIEYVWREVKII